MASSRHAICAVQFGQRAAASGIASVHCGHGFVFGAAGTGCVISLFTNFTSRNTASATMTTDSRIAKGGMIDLYPRTH